MAKVVWQTMSDNAAQTEELGERLGRVLQGGEVIELVSDLGGGKTTFVRGLVRGLQSADKVASPTFTISKLYRAGDLEVHHFDFYRLQEAGIMAEELAEVAGDTKAIVVVEWGDVVQHVLPAERLTLSIKQTPSGSRQLLFQCPESLQHLIRAMEQS
jgi:tRNA threonylcarbamoyladenosine biosynthesis protein TsaE